jgi:hypothetical protein
MAISTSFNGATLYRPGAYSKTEIDLGGGLPLGPAGLVAVIGEADAGAPGNQEVDIKNNRFGGDQLVAIREKYRSGPIVDSASFLFAPAADAAIPNGAQTVWFYKTNQSTHAELALANSYGTVQSVEWGVGGNRVTYKNVLVGESAPAKNGSDLTFAPTAEVTNVTMTLGGAGLDGATGKYWTLWSANDAAQYYVWYNVTDGIPPVDPAPLGMTGVEVQVLLADTPAQVAVKTAAALDALAAFSVPVPAAATITVTNAGTGPSTDAADVDAGVSVSVTTQGDLASGATLNGASFSIRQNGGPSVAVVTLSGTEANHDSIADLVVELNGLLPAGMEAEASLSGNGIALKMTDLATAHQLGWGRSFELIDSTPGDLAKLGLTAGLSSALVEPSCSITMSQKRDLIEETEELGGNVVLTIGNDGTEGNTSASVTVTASAIQLLEDAVIVHSFLKDSFATIGDLVAEINLASYAGWTASVTNGLYNQLPLSVLDQVSAVGAFSASGAKPARLKKDADDVAQLFANSALASIEDQAVKGLPEAQIELSLAGGTKGGTTPADIVEALEKFQKFHVNFVLPLFSRDASDDITDGLTDSSSTYTIAGIHQLIKTHLSLMKTTKKRSERQAYLSLKASFDDSKDVAGNLADGRIQLFIQDIRQTDAQSTIKWFQPWALAALACGARSGSPVGLPLTFKFMNASGLRHTAQPMSTAEADIVIDFDPDLQTDEAIQAGITFMENPQTGGFRVVVDNTTYGRDRNFVWNRANVVYAADIVAFNLRTALENRFVGQKNTISAADVSLFVTSIMGQFLTQGITVSTSDATLGFKNLIARIDGNTIYVDLVIKIVEGIDFVLTTISVQRATQE